MVNHGQSWSIMVNHGQSWSIMVNHGQSPCSFSTKREGIHLGSSENHPEIYWIINYHHFHSFSPFKWLFEGIPIFRNTQLTKNTLALTPPVGLSLLSPRKAPASHSPELVTSHALEMRHMVCIYTFVCSSCGNVCTIHCIL